MKQILRFALPVSIFLLFVLSRPAHSVNLEEGEKVFSANCAPCHAGGNNVIAPEKTLKEGALQDNSMKSVDAIKNQVTNGKNAMPAFGGRLTDEEIADVADYVLTQAERGW